MDEEQSYISTLSSVKYIDAGRLATKNAIRFTNIVATARITKIGNSKRTSVQDSDKIDPTSFPCTKTRFTNFGGTALVYEDGSVVTIGLKHWEQSIRVVQTCRLREFYRFVEETRKNPVPLSAPPMITSIEFNNNVAAANLGHEVNRVKLQQEESDVILNARVFVGCVVPFSNIESKLDPATLKELYRLAKDGGRNAGSVKIKNGTMANVFNTGRTNFLGQFTYKQLLLIKPYFEKFIRRYKGREIPENTNEKTALSIKNLQKQAWKSNKSVQRVDDAHQIKQNEEARKKRFSNLITLEKRPDIKRARTEE